MQFLNYVASEVHFWVLLSDSVQLWSFTCKHPPWLPCTYY